MAVTAAWTVSAQVEVVTSWGSFMIPKITLVFFAYLVARELQRAANSTRGQELAINVVVSENELSLLNGRITQFLLLRIIWEDLRSFVGPPCPMICPFQRA